MEVNTVFRSAMEDKKQDFGEHNKQNQPSAELFSSDKSFKI